MNLDNIRTTNAFEKSANMFIAECEAKRKEILDAGKDTADDTNLPTIECLIEDAIFIGADEDGECYNYWGVTDNYDSDYPFVCKMYDIDGVTVFDAA